MKPTTQARIDRAIAIIEAGPKSGVSLTLRETLELLVLETDRETRYACAEAMLKLPHDMQHLDAYHACLKVETV